MNAWKYIGKCNLLVVSFLLLVGGESKIVVFFSGISPYLTLNYFLEHCKHFQSRYCFGKCLKVILKIGRELIGEREHCLDFLEEKCL